MHILVPKLIYWRVVIMRKSVCMNEMFEDVMWNRFDSDTISWLFTLLMLCKNHRIFHGIHIVRSYDQIYVQQTIEMNSQAWRKYMHDCLKYETDDDDLGFSIEVFPEKRTRSIEIERLSDHCRSSSDGNGWVFFECWLWTSSNGNVTVENLSCERKSIDVQDFL